MHYNTVPRELERYWRDAAAPRFDQDFVSAQYFGLLRNYRDGGSSVSIRNSRRVRSFVPGESTPAEPLRHVTTRCDSLSMSDLGYEQESGRRAVSVNSLEEYVRAVGAVRKPNPIRAHRSEVDGEISPVNANLLQIENEYYSTSVRALSRARRAADRALSRGASSTRFVRSTSARSIPQA